MNANDLLDIIGNVDDRMLAMAKDYRKQKISTLVKFGAVAACFCLIAGGIVAHNHNMTIALPLPKE